MKIHEVFEKKVNELKADDRVMGILITGSLARGTETEYSDLDIIAIGDKNEIIEEVIDGIPVETHYNKVESIKKWFIADPPSCYLYTYGKVVYEREKVLGDLIKTAKNRLDTYEVTDIRKVYLNHKLGALKEKLTASLALKDEQKINYLVCNNFKMLLESVYALNSLPVPPQGLNYEIYDRLLIKPCDDWMLKLVNLSGIELGKYVMGIIEFIRL